MCSIIGDSLITLDSVSKLNILYMTIEINKIIKSYNDKIALQIEYLQLSSGIVGVFGENGAGKTTCLDLIVQVITPNKGTIKYDGESYDILPKEVKLRIGYLSSVDSLFSNYSIKEYLTLISKIYLIKQDIAEKRINELCSLFFKSTNCDGMIYSLSTGNKKKLEFCASIIHKPNLLILDEPFSGIDPVSANIITKILTKHSKEDNKLVLISSHNLYYLEGLISHAIVIRHGKILLNEKIIDSNKQIKNIEKILLYNTTSVKENSNSSWI